MRRFRFNLQLFAGDGDGAGASAGSAAGAADSGTTGATGDAGAEAAAPQYIPRSGRRRTEQANPLADVQYGIQPQAQPAQAKGQDDAASEDGKESFDDLIKGRYKADFENRVQKILDGRFKKANETQAQMDKVNSFLPQLMQKYGLGEGATLDDLARKVTDDESLYEDEALQMGVSTSVARDMHRLQSQLEAERKAREQSVEEMRIREHLASLAQQAEQLKAVFPGFDLMTELNNSPEFARMTSPEVGISVEAAYRAIHAKEIESAAMQYGAQRAASQVTAAVRANGARPAENGMGGQAGVVSKVDPSTLNKRDIEEIKRRIARGETISFG